MTFSLDAGLTLPFLTFVIASGFISGIHPAFISTFPLMLGSYLGNEIRLRHALRGATLFIILLAFEWALIGVGMAIATTLGPTSTVQNVLAVLIAVIGALELKSALSSTGIAMELSPRIWRHIRKHAYRLTRPRQIISLNLHLLPLLLLLTAWPLLGVSAITTMAPAPLTLTVVAIYTVSLVIPLAIVAFLPDNNIRLSSIRHHISRLSPLMHLLQAIVLGVCSWLLLAAAENPRGTT